MPVNQDSLVRCQIRAGDRTKAENQHPMPAKNWRWHHTGGPGDVVFYEQTGEFAA